MGTKDKEFNSVWSELVKADASKQEVMVTKFQAGILFERGFKASQELKQTALENLPLAELKILIDDCHKSMEGCKNKAGELDAVGEEFNDKLGKLCDIYDAKVEGYINSIKLTNNENTSTN